MSASDAALLLFVVALVIVVALLSQLRDWVSSLLSTYAGEKLLRGFRAQLFRHLQRLSLSYHDTKGTADSIYRIQNAAAAVLFIGVRDIQAGTMTSGQILLDGVDLCEYKIADLRNQFALVLQEPV